MSRKNNIEKLIFNYELRLQKLKEQQALRGLDTPPHILIEIEDIEAVIKELHAELVALESSGINEKPLGSISEMTPRQLVQIHLQGDFSSLSADRQSAAIDAFAAVMGISPQAIEVRRVYEGSIVFDLGIPPDAAERLRSRLRSNSIHLRLLKVERVILERQSAEIEEWVIEEGKFHLVSSTHPSISNGVQGRSQRATEHYPELPLRCSLRDALGMGAKRLTVFCTVILRGFVRAWSSLKAWVETKARTKALAEARAEAGVRAEIRALAKALVEVLQTEAWFLDTAMADALAKAEAHAGAVALLLTKAEARAEARTGVQALAEVRALAEAKALAKVLAEVEARAESEVLAKDETQVKAQDEALIKARAIAEAMVEAITQLTST